MSQQCPREEDDEQYHKWKRHQGQDSRAGDDLGALREHLIGLLGPLGQARQPLTLLRQELVLPLQRLRLTLELKPLAVPDLFEQSSDPRGLLVIHCEQRTNVDGACPRRGVPRAVAGSIGLALRHAIGDLVIVAFVGHEGVLRQLESGRRLQRSHPD